MIKTNKVILQVTRVFLCLFCFVVFCVLFICLLVFMKEARSFAETLK